MVATSSPPTALRTQYQRAKNLLQNYGPATIVANATVFPIWIEGTNSFWYERDINLSKNTECPDQPLKPWDREYRLVNAKNKTNRQAFDPTPLASALAQALGKTVDKHQLPITDAQFQLDSSEQVDTIRFKAFNKSWLYNPLSDELLEKPLGFDPGQGLLSPDGKAYLFTQNHNLYLYDLASGEERALTEDGEEHYPYAVVGNGWGIDMHTLGSAVQARWSPDSQRVLTVQRDSRQVKTLPIVEHVPQDGSLRPKLHSLKIALQGDEHIPEYRLVAIDLASGRLQAAHYPKLPIVRNSGGFFDSHLGWWAADSKRAYFVELERGYRTARVVEFDTTTGNTRVLFEDHSATHLNLMVNEDELPTIMPLPDTNELIWFSERSGWAQLYLYDLNTGELKNAITSGEWVVRNILSVNLQTREVFLHTMGRTPNRDPYYRDLVRVNLDTGKLTEIAASDDDYFAVSDHCFDMETNGFSMQRDIAMARSISHNGEYAVATRSRVDSVPVTVLLDHHGNEILEVERGDLTALYARVSDQWQWPEPVQLMASDSITPIYGVVWRPSDFTPDQSYPVIMSGFSTPELPRVPKGSFTNGSSGGAYYCSNGALAELGFIVVQIDARGTPFRGKAFQDTSYGWAESAGSIDDQAAAIRQLGERYPYMDMDRVGINTIGGGTGAVQGLLHHSDLFKVGVHGSLHDSRLMAAPMWSDKYEGLAGPDANHQYAEAYAENLQGKLLLMCGMLDFCTLPANTFRVVEALQKANKDFDLMLLPNLSHGISLYLVRRAWDYFVRHLLHEEPPKGISLMNKE